MGYYIRVLGTELDTPELDDIREAASHSLKSPNILTLFGQSLF
jgi:hypothetical protein